MRLNCKAQNSQEIKQNLENNLWQHIKVFQFNT